MIESFSVSCERARLAMAISKAKSQEKINWIENGEKMDLDSAVDYNNPFQMLQQLNSNPYFQ